MNRLSSAKVRKLVTVYLAIKQEVINRGYGLEIDWQDTRKLGLLSESEFLQESAWVILCAGMRESVVRGVFIKISAAFMDWRDAASVILNLELCKSRALAVFNHPRKISAIISLCSRVDEMGFDNIKEIINKEGVDFLKSFEYIGPVTCYHLAKNIGLDVAKPDRHLTRISKASRISQPQELCSLISAVTGDRISVIDLVLWRYATIDTNYASFFNSLA